MELQLEETPVSLACHPSSNLIAVGSIDGTVSTFLYSQTATNSDDSSSRLSFENCLKRKQRAPIRKVRFSSRGDRLYSLTRNKTLTCWDPTTNQKCRVIRRVTGQDGFRPYCLHVLGEHQLAIGDEGGVIRVLDWRCKDDPPLAARLSDPDTDQYLTDLTSDSTGRLLLASCGDCTLLAMDLRKKKLITKSEPMHDELLCLSPVQNETKLLCGSADGFFDVFNWNEWGNLVERVDTGHKDTVDCLLKLDENLVVSGSGNGSIRLHHVLPNKTLKIIGRHDSNSPVEDLALTTTSYGGQQNDKSANKQWLVSCGQDSKVKFWDAESLKKFVPVLTKSGSLLKKLTKKVPKNSDSTTSKKAGRIIMEDFFTDLEENKINCDKNNDQSGSSNNSNSSGDDQDSDSN